MKCQNRLAACTTQTAENQKLLKQNQNSTGPSTFSFLQHSNGAMASLKNVAVADEARHIKMDLLNCQNTCDPVQFLPFLGSRGHFFHREVESFGTSPSPVRLLKTTFQRSALEACNERFGRGDHGWVVF